MYNISKIRSQKYKNLFRLVNLKIKGGSDEVPIFSWFEETEYNKGDWYPAITPPNPFTDIQKALEDLFQSTLKYNQDQINSMYRIKSYITELVKRDIYIYQYNSDDMTDSSIKRRFRRIEDPSNRNKYIWQSETENGSNDWKLAETPNPYPEIKQYLENLYQFYKANYLDQEVIIDQYDPYNIQISKITIDEEGGPYIYRYEGRDEARLLSKRYKRGDISKYIWLYQTIDGSWEEMERSIVENLEFRYQLTSKTGKPSIINYDTVGIVIKMKKNPDGSIEIIRNRDTKMRRLQL